MPVNYDDKANDEILKKIIIMEKANYVDKLMSENEIVEKIKKIIEEGALRQ